MLSGKQVVLGVTGGIAAYKSCELVSRLRKAGASVDVIMTKNACQFVAPLSFSTLSHRPVVTDTFAPPAFFEVEHIALAKKADLFVIAPATANFLAKMAHGIADDMLTTTVLATKAPILIAPAMNTAMWENPATQANLQQLRSRGVHCVGPEGGLLACGDEGKGRMSEAGEIFSACQALLLPKRDMAGLQVLVTAGPTRERLDPVRFLTNHSTGKMGYAIAEAARKRGAKVCLVSGVTDLPRPKDVELVKVVSTEDLLEAVMARAAEQDLIIQAAAPADYRPKERVKEKLKKDGEGLSLSLVPTPDVAKAVGEKKRPGQLLVGFAAETENLLQNAAKKLAKKNLDLIVANDISRPGAGFGVDTNIVTLLSQSGQEDLPLMSKAEVAERILDKALLIRAQKS